MATSQDFVNWVCSPELAPRFLQYAILAEGDHLLEFGKGTTHTTIYFPAVLAFHICMPPRAEQERIVEKVEALLAQVGTARERLIRARDILKRFRQSVLAVACSGRLTEGWRGERANAGDGGSGDGLPDGWAASRAADACHVVQSGGTPPGKPFTRTGDVPFLKIYNIVDQRVDFEARPQFIPASVHQGRLRRSKVLPGDILMNIVGPPLGKVAIVPPTHPEWNINQAIVTFRPGPRLTTPFLYFLLCEGSAIRQIANEYRGSAGQVNISLSQARELSVPLPTIREQNEIIRRVQALFTLADTIETSVEIADVRAETLTRAVMAKAFRGERLAIGHEPAASGLAHSLLHPLE